ncbi:MAG: hypothetical protein PHS54_03300 [Clostridia bacterium]|jgi:hypothetical protein|nr:hypothetical protein [Clostridia bacterium]
MNIERTKLNWIKSKNEISMDFELDVAIHPFNNGKIIINYPGADGSIDGYNDKYVKIADYLIDQKIGAVVRIPNISSLGFGWDINLRKTLTYVLDNSKKICGNNKPEIYLMGTSAGAGAIAMTAWEYPEVTKILLTEPAIIFSGEHGVEGIREYKGDVTIVVGKGSNALGKEIGDKFFDYFINAKHKEIIEIENCDHQFKGEINGRIMSESPIYAFAEGEKIKFPDPNGGIKLYD